MKYIFILFLFATHFTIGQSINPDKLIELYTTFGAYRYMDVQPEMKQLDALKNEENEQLTFVSELILNGIQSPKLLLTENYLILPDTAELRTVYVLNSLYYHTYYPTQKDQRKLIDSLQTATISKPDLILGYYDFLFSLAFKQKANRDMSQLNIDLNRCVQNDSIGQTILFLELFSQSMKNIARSPAQNSSPNQLEALEAEYRKLPTFTAAGSSVANTQPFHAFTGFPSIDFNVLHHQRTERSFYKIKLEWYLINLYGYYILGKIEWGLEASNERIWLKTALHRSDLYGYVEPLFGEQLKTINDSVNKSLNEK